MTSTARHPGIPGDIEVVADDPVVALLAAAMDHTDQILRAEAARFTLAAAWGELHPGHRVDPTRPWEERDLEVAGPGAPTVAEFTIAAFALAVGTSTDAGTRYVGDAVEVRHRLPRLWARVVKAEVAVWRARKIAQATRTLPADAAGYVDRHLAPVADTCTWAQLDRTVETARAEHDPAAAEARRLEAAERRRFTVHLDQTGPDGLVPVDGWLDLPDALALESAIAAKATELLQTLPDQLPLDVRRAMAAGRLANTTDQSTGREVVIYTHLDSLDSLVDVEATRSVTTPDGLASWCWDPATTRVTVRPVLDLDAELYTPRYRPTADQVEQAVLNHPTCVFPGCGRTARDADIDHIIAFEDGGPTTSWNLAPSCRGHHRLKTHSGWTYQRLTRTTVEWTSPTGRTYTVTSRPRHTR